MALLELRLIEVSGLEPPIMAVRVLSVTRVDIDADAEPQISVRRLNDLVPNDALVTI